MDFFVCGKSHPLLFRPTCLLLVSFGAPLFFQQKQLSCPLTLVAPRHSRLLSQQRSPSPLNYSSDGHCSASLIILVARLFTLPCQAPMKSDGGAGLAYDVTCMVCKRHNAIPCFVPYSFPKMSSHPTCLLTVKTQMISS